MNLLSGYSNYLLMERKYSKLTANAYVSDVKLFFNYLKDEQIDLKDIDYFIIRHYIVYLSANEYSRNSIKRNLSSVSNFLNYAVKNQLVSQNYIHLIESIRGDKYLPDFLFIDEVRLLIKACNNRKYKYRDKLILMLLFLNGLRVSEVANIKISDIKKNRIKILCKVNKERYAIISSQSIDVLKKYL
ncbi:MAG: tyrosine-type recombinase/integrase, partial [Bacilli bacterium]